MGVNRLSAFDHCLLDSYQNSWLKGKHEAKSLHLRISRPRNPKVRRSRVQCPAPLSSSSDGHHRPRLRRQSSIRSALRGIHSWVATLRACVLRRGKLSCRILRRALEGGIVANHRQGLPAASSRDWWRPGQGAGHREIRMGEAGQRSERNGRGGHRAAEATRDGGGDLRYASPAWAGRRSLEPGGVMCRSPRFGRSGLRGLSGRGRNGAGAGRGRWESRAGQPTSLFPSHLFPALRAGRLTVLRHPVQILELCLSLVHLSSVSFSFFVEW